MGRNGRYLRSRAQALTSRAAIRPHNPIDKQIASRFNDQVIEILDTPGLPDREALQQQIDILFIAGNIKQWIGHLVCVNIHDSNEQKFAAAADKSFPHIAAVQSEMEKSHRPLPADVEKTRHSIKRIDARIFSIADVFDALTSKRPYKDSSDFETAIDALRKKRGHHLDPKLVDTFILIAKSLYDNLSNGSDDQPRRKLEEILQRYFDTGLETIRS